MASAFNLRPEAFEFDPELDESERGWGELEGDFEQYETSIDELEGGQPPQPAECPPYQRGEVERSRTTQGHLLADVIEPADGGLLITDFGVDWRTPKASLGRDAVLRRWINEVISKARTNASTAIYITGYSDCVGREKDNTVLRRSRAKKVEQLLQQLAGPNARYLSGKIKADAAPAGWYIAGNSTIQGRAQNRGVRIAIRSQVRFAPDTITSRFPPPTPPSDIEDEPEFIQRVLTRARALFGRTDRWDQFGMPINEARRQRVLCLLDQIAKPSSDVRYLTALAVERFDQYPSIPQPEFSDAIAYLVPVKQPWGVDPRLATPARQRTDREIWRAVSLLEADIRAGIRMITQMFELRQSAVMQRVQRLRSWVEGQQNNPLSIYRCFK